MAAVVALVGGLQQQFWFQSCQWKPHCLFWRQNLLWCLSRRTTFLKQKRFLMLTLSAGNMFGGYVAVQCVPVGGLTMHNMGALFIVWTNWSHHVASDHRVNWQGPGLDVSADPHRCSDEQRIRLHSYILLDFYCGFRWFQMISFCFCTRTDFQWDLFPNCNEYVT